MSIVLAIAIIAALSAAVITDLRVQRIPNLITLPLALFGLIFHVLTGGLDGLLFALAGLGLGLGLMLLPYLFGFMGGGDVKLLAALGACLGAADIFTAFIYTAIAGGAYGLIVLLFKRDLLREIFSRIWTTLWLFTATRKMDYAPVDSESTATPRLCYGVAIAIGTAGAMITSSHLDSLF